MVKKITKTKIIELYINNYNQAHYLREIALLLKKPHQSIKPYLEKLTKENILLKNKRLNLTEYKLNLKDKRILDYITIAEKEKTIEKLENTTLKILFEKLSPFFKNNTFIIFGSSVQEIKKGSDIDLLIIGKSKINKTIKEFEEVYNKEIHKIQVTDLNKLTKTLTIEIYKKHLILNNTEEIIRSFLEKNETNQLV